MTLRPTRASQVLIYGVAVSKETAHMIRTNYYNEQEDWYALVAKKASENNFEGAFSRRDSVFPGHNRHAGDLVFHPVLRTHWTNPMVEVERDYEAQEAVQHYFGIFVAEDFWGDDNEYFLQAQKPELLLKNYERTVQPILKRLHISDGPNYHTLTQYMRHY